MKGKLITAFAVAALCVLALCAGGGRVSSGRAAPALLPGTGQDPGVQELERAPDFSLVDTYGDKVRLSDLRGRIVVLHFWAEWCASCKVDLEYFQEVSERYRAEDVVVLGLAYASGGRKDVRAFVERLGVTFPTVICDEETRAAYSVAGLPTNVIVDRSGMIRHVSRRLMNPTYWDQLLGELVAPASSE